jgi:hypothetical protein
MGFTAATSMKPEGNAGVPTSLRWSQWNARVRQSLEIYKSAFGPEGRQASEHIDGTFRRAIQLNFRRSLEMKTDRGSVFK